MHEIWKQSIMLRLSKWYTSDRYEIERNVKLWVWRNFNFVACIPVFLAVCSISCKGRRVRRLWRTQVRLRWGIIVAWTWAARPLALYRVYSCLIESSSIFVVVLYRLLFGILDNTCGEVFLKQFMTWFTFSQSPLYLLVFCTFVFM